MFKKLFARKSSKDSSAASAAPKFHRRYFTCESCRGQFFLTPIELRFFAMQSIPSPKICRECAAPASQVVADKAMRRLANG